VAPLVKGIAKALVDGVSEVGYATHPWARALGTDCHGERGREAASGLDKDVESKERPERGNGPDVRQPPDSRQPFDAWSFPHPDLSLFAGPL
jgi:hypothetical protein